MGGRGSRRSLQLRNRVAELVRVQANLAKIQQPDQAQTPSQPRPKSRRRLGDSGYDNFTSKKVRKIQAVLPSEGRQFRITTESY